MWDVIVSVPDHCLSSYILNICNETAKIAHFHFSHYKSMATVSCHSNQSSYRPVARYGLPPRGYFVDHDFLEA